MSTDAHAPFLHVGIREALTLCWDADEQEEGTRSQLCLVPLVESPPNPTRETL